MKKFLYAIAATCLSAAASASVYQLDFNNEYQAVMGTDSRSRYTISADGRTLDVETVAWCTLDSLPVLKEGFELQLKLRHYASGNTKIVFYESNRSDSNKRTFQLGTNGSQYYYWNGIDQHSYQIRHTTKAEGGVLTDEDAENPSYDLWRIVATTNGLSLWRNGNEVPLQGTTPTGAPDEDECFNLLGTWKIGIEPENGDANVKRRISDVTICTEGDQPPDDPSDLVTKLEVDYNDRAKFIPNKSYPNWEVFDAGKGLRVNTVAWYTLGSLPKVKDRLTLAFEARLIEKGGFYLTLTDTKGKTRRFQFGDSGLYYSVDGASKVATGTLNALPCGASLKEKDPEFDVEQTPYRKFELRATANGFYVRLDGQDAQKFTSDPATSASLKGSPLEATDDFYLLDLKGVEVKFLGASSNCKYDVKNFVIDATPPPPGFRIFIR